MADDRIRLRCARVSGYYDLAVEEGINVEFVPGAGTPFSDDELADVALCNSLLDLERYTERQRVQRQWVALEALLPLIPPGGDVSEVVYLPRSLAVRAARLALACGWFFGEAAGPDG